MKHNNDASIVVMLRGYGYTARGVIYDRNTFTVQVSVVAVINYNRNTFTAQETELAFK